MDDAQWESPISPSVDLRCESVSGLIEGFAIIEPQSVIGDVELGDRVGAAYEKGLTNANSCELGLLNPCSKMIGEIVRVGSRLYSQTSVRPDIIISRTRR